MESRFRKALDNIIKYNLHYECQNVRYSYYKCDRKGCEEYAKRELSFRTDDYDYAGSINYCAEHMTEWLTVYANYKEQQFQAYMYFLAISPDIATYCRDYVKIPRLVIND